MELAEGRSKQYISHNSTKTDKLKVPSPIRQVRHRPRKRHDELKMHNLSRPTIDELSDISEVKPREEENIFDISKYDEE